MNSVVGRSAKSDATSNKITVGTFSCSVKATTFENFNVALHKMLIVCSETGVICKAT